MENTNCINFGGQPTMLEDTAARNMTANPYDGESTYKKGAICIQNNKLYEAKQNIDAAEQFTEAHWNETTLGDIVAKNKSDISTLNEKLPSPILLWENSNSSQSMAVNTVIELSSDDYEWLEIYYKAATTSNSFCCQKCKKGDNVNLLVNTFPGSDSGYGSRTLTYVDDTHYKSGTSWMSMRSAGNMANAPAYGIPVKIYGIK